MVWVPSPFSRLNRRSMLFAAFWSHTLFKAFGRLSLACAHYLQPLVALASCLHAICSIWWLYVLSTHLYATYTIYILPEYGRKYLLATYAPICCYSLYARTPSRRAKLSSFALGGRGGREATVRHGQRSCYLCYSYSTCHMPWAKDK